MTETAGSLPVISATEPDFAYGFTAQARIRPRGRPCKWFVEYGATTAYGTTTSARMLPPKRTAHYKETWDADEASFAGGISANKLSWQAGGFVRYDASTDTDDGNHVTGLGALGLPNLGILRLPLYIHHGSNDGGGAPFARFGGGFPDLRGATLSMRIRGNAWDSNGGSLKTWIQAPNGADLCTQPVDPDVMNWFHYGAGTTWDDAAATGSWETVSVTLSTARSAWRYAGRNDDHAIQRYWYGELDGCMWDDGAPEGGGGGGVLGNMYDDMFPVQCIDIAGGPSGTLDFDDFEVTYPNHNVCLSTNGGTLALSPGTGTGAEYLTDGWRNVDAGGAGEWQSANPASFPLDFEYTFADPITLYAAMVHNSTSNPSAGVEIHVSENNGGAWTTVYTGTLPNGANGNFNYVLKRNAAVSGYYEPIHANPVNRVRVRVTSAVGAIAGLGEIEFFGTGAKCETENETHDVSRDVLVSPGTYHYRIGYTIDGVTRYGPDQTATVTQLTPSMTYSIPETIPAAGGVATLYGTNISDGSPTVDFLPGGAPTSTTGMARSRLKMTVGAVATGDLQPRITTPGGTTARTRLFAYTLSSTTVARGATFTITGGDYSTVTAAYVGGASCSFSVGGGGSSITITVHPSTPTGNQAFILWDPNDVRDGVIYFYDGADPPNQVTINIT